VTAHAPRLPRDVRLGFLSLRMSYSENRFPLFQDMR
jgi:hypothetical protein